MKKTSTSHLKTLGKSRAKFAGLETFQTPKHCGRVVCISDEVTADCPVTSAPDWYVVEIDYNPDGLCIESKSLKLYLQSHRSKGMFCESFADKICNELFAALKPYSITVTVKQKPRGGIAIHSTSYRSK